MQARPGPIDGRASAHLLLHSRVTLACPCGAPVWRAVDCCHATRDNEPEFALVSPLQCIIYLTTNLSGFDINLGFKQDKPEEEQGCRGLESSSPGLYCLVGRERVKPTVLPPWRTT
jgi:hypothetical protein